MKQEKFIGVSIRDFKIYGYDRSSSRALCNLKPKYPTLHPFNYGDCDHKSYPSFIDKFKKDDRIIRAGQYNEYLIDYFINNNRKIDVSSKEYEKLIHARAIIRFDFTDSYKKRMLDIPNGIPLVISLMGLYSDYFWEIDINKLRKAFQLRDTYGMNDHDESRPRFKIIDDILKTYIDGIEIRTNEMVSNHDRSFQYTVRASEIDWKLANRLFSLNDPGITKYALNRIFFIGLINRTTYFRDTQRDIENKKYYRELLEGYINNPKPIIRDSIFQLIEEEIDNNLKLAENNQQKYPNILLPFEDMKSECIFLKKIANKLSDDHNKRIKQLQKIKKKDTVNRIMKAKELYNKNCMVRGKEIY